MFANWIADGHRLAVKLGPDYRLTPEIVCTPEKCTAHWYPDSKPADAPSCWLAYVCQDVGSEFLEWWTAQQTGNVKEVEINGPFLIEWFAEGGEEGATWWRPVEPDREEARDPNMVMAVAA